MDTTVSTLTRYPIKGLSGQILHSVQLEAGKGFPNDRRFGFARPKSGFDPQNPRPLPKSKFYMLARDASLALLSTEYNDDTGVLSIVAPRNKGQFDISNDDGKHDANKFLKTYLSLPTDETPHLYEASPHRFTDVSVVSSAMTAHVDYYFSLTSPWSYLGHERFLKIASNAGATVTPYEVSYRGTIFAATGGLPVHKRSAQRQAYRLQELARWRDHLGIHLNVHPKHWPNDETVAASMVIALRETESTEAALKFMESTYWRWLRTRNGQSFASRKPMPPLKKVFSVHQVTVSKIRFTGVRIDWILYSATLIGLVRRTIEADDFRQHAGSGERFHYSG